MRFSPAVDCILEQGRLHGRHTTFFALWMLANQRCHVDIYHLTATLALHCLHNILTASTELLAN